MLCQGLDVNSDIDLFVKFIRKLCNECMTYSQRVCVREREREGGGGGERKGGRERYVNLSGY